MRQSTTAIIEVKGRRHQVEATVNVLSDRATIVVDGAPTSSTLVRRPFSPLFRYRFEIDSEPWEFRVCPDGLRNLTLTVVPATARGGSPGISTAALAAGAGLPGAVGALVLTGAGLVEAGPSAAIGLGAAVGTFAICWLVFGRRTEV